MMGENTTTLLTPIIPHFMPSRALTIRGQRWVCSCLFVRPTGGLLRGSAWTVFDLSCSKHANQLSSKEFSR